MDAKHVASVIGRIAFGAIVVTAIVKELTDRNKTEKVAPLDRKREELEKQAAERTGGRMISDADQKKILDMLALYADLYRIPLGVENVTYENGAVCVEYSNGGSETFFY